MFYRGVFLSEDHTITVFITTVVPVVLAGFQASTFTVGKRDALRVSGNSVKVKVKVKFTPEQVTKAQRESRGIALLFH
jgi:hypothetical protein